jgi:geranylgeranyl transferase type-2 subunit alpha
LITRFFLALVHCWHYRRFIAEHGKVAVSSELAYTRVKIDQNFSNYSAWHQRSLLLAASLNTADDVVNTLSSGTTMTKTNESQRHEKPESLIVVVVVVEFELLQKAYYTEPNDQSTWVYHRWLVGQCKRFKTLARACSLSSLTVAERQSSKRRRRRCTARRCGASCGTATTCSSSSRTANVPLSIVGDQ